MMITSNLEIGFNVVFMYLFQHFYHITVNITRDKFKIPTI